MQDFQAKLTQVIADVIEPNAPIVDKEGRFPRAAIDELARIGALGLISAKEHGGLGESLRTTSELVERVSAACASSGMVLCMHYCAASVIEKLGKIEVRKAIALNKHLGTLAFTEPGSRSNYWATENKAVADGDRVRINGTKSWVTSAGEADSILWATAPLSGTQGACSMWFVPTSAPGLRISGNFDGFGLRGNASRPVTAENVVVPRDSLLGEDAKGEDVMHISFPWFEVLSSSCSLGIMEAAIAKATKHVTNTRFSHSGLPLSDLMTIRAYLARARVKAHLVQALIRDTISAIEAKREDVDLRILEVKAASGEAVCEVTELAMRICGGAAFRKEGGIERHFRDARASVIMSPTADILYDLIGKTMCGIPVS